MVTNQRKATLSNNPKVITTNVTPAQASNHSPLVYSKPKTQPKRVHDFGYQISECCVRRSIIGACSGFVYLLLAADEKSRMPQRRENITSRQLRILTQHYVRVYPRHEYCETCTTSAAYVLHLVLNSSLNTGSFHAT